MNYRFWRHPAAAYCVLTLAILVFFVAELQSRSFNSKLWFVLVLVMPTPVVTWLAATRPDWNTWKREDWETLAASWLLLLIFPLAYAIPDMNALQSSNEFLAIIFFTPLLVNYLLFCLIRTAHFIWHLDHHYYLKKYWKEPFYVALVLAVMILALKLIPPSEKSLMKKAAVQESIETARKQLAEKSYAGCVSTLWKHRRKKEALELLDQCVTKLSTAASGREVASDR